MLDALGNALLIELELVSIVLVHVRQVQSEAHDITLNSIVTFIVIIINYHQVTLLERCRHVLEIVEVEWIRQDVVRVAALQGAALGHLRF